MVFICSEKFWSRDQRKLVSSFPGLVAQQIISLLKLIRWKNWRESGAWSNRSATLGNYHRFWVFFCVFFFKATAVVFRRKWLSLPAETGWCCCLPSNTASMSRNHCRGCHHGLHRQLLFRHDLLFFLLLRRGLGCVKHFAWEGWFCILFLGSSWCCLGPRNSRKEKKKEKK